MAVPSIPQPRTGGAARGLRRSVPADVCVGLLAVLVPPLVFAAVPNTVVVVAEFLPDGVSRVEMTRAFGLALPAMLLAVPAGALAVRRFRAFPVLVAGLALLTAAGLAGGSADTPPEVGALRGLYGFGAGVAVAATLAAVWERGRAARRVLLPVWAASLTTGLLAAQALALWPLSRVVSWQVILWPYPAVAVPALAVAVAGLLLDRARAARAAAEPAPPAPRRPLLLAAALAAGTAGVALGASFGWAPPLLLAAAGAVTVALLVLAGVLGAERVTGFAMVALGVVVLPTAAQLTYLELEGLGGPGLSAVWPVLAAAALAALAAALVTMRLNEGALVAAAGWGLGVVVAGLCAVRLLMPATSGVPLAVPFVVLAAGTAMAGTAALRYGGPGGALFGASLFFPAVIGGFLLGTGIQVSFLRGAGESVRSLAEGMGSVLHRWALVGGVLVVVVLVLIRLLAGRGAAARPEPEAPRVMVPAPSPSPEDASAGGDGGRGPAR